MDILNLENHIIHTIEKSITKLSIEYKEWLSLKEGASYAGVSYNTFIKFRSMGLKVTEIDGVKRVSKKEVDRFMESYSF
ncbi:MerR family transcriptional regulator [Solibacillus merdavium]|uniref:DNA-binding protein n=1 Tax=Solibacillus merdavium TaxID=2762218 RepID=A0ABR8XPD2_9BACL|nr:DNA-binding protein [Solibacillus merdavium]MBD8033814.1 DNA-binding protein [Solibacillus merdavium]